MKLKNIIPVLILLLISYSCKSQVSVYLNDYYKGEYLAVQGDSTILRAEPDIESAIIDTVYSDSDYLSFIVLNDSVINNYVKVKIVTVRIINGVPSKDRVRFGKPTIIKDGKLGWVSKNELKKHPIPHHSYFYSYKENEDMLLSIIKSAEWHLYNNNKYYQKCKWIHAQSYFNLGKIYYEADSFKKAIFYLTKCNQILPKFNVYTIKALSKLALKDYYGAINDCTSGLFLINNLPKTKEFSVYPVYIDYYNYDIYGIRGYCYLKTQKYSLAVLDLNIAIKNDGINGNHYYNRGIAKLNLGQKAAGCLDLSKAGELGYEEAFELIKEYCNK